MWKGPATLRSSVRFTWCGAGAGAGVGGSIGAGGLAVLAFVDAEKTMKATAIKIENCIFAIASLILSLSILLSQRLNNAKIRSLSRTHENPA